MFGLSPLGMDSLRIVGLPGKRRDKSREAIAEPATGHPAHGGAGCCRELHVQKPPWTTKRPLGISMRTRVKQPINREKESWGRCTGKEGLS